MEESLGLGKKSYSTETDTKTWCWFRYRFGCTLRYMHSSLAPLTARPNNTRLKNIRTYQKSFGDPNHVNGVNETATITIHKHIEGLYSPSMVSNNETQHDAIKTINTQPAP